MESKRKIGLGKGIGSLMQDFSYDSVLDNALSSSKKEEKGDRVLEVDLDAVRPNPNQPRKEFDSATLEELAQSIRREGVLQPILVEEIGPNRYSIVAGERRYRASKMAGLKTIPVLVKDVTQMQRLEISLIENIQRESLNPIEEAQAYAYLIQEAGITQEELARRLGKNRSTISNSIRLLQLSPVMQEELLKGKFTAGHARAILSVVNPADREILYKTLLERDLSVRATEEMASQFNQGRRVAHQKKKRSKKEVEKRLEVLAAEESFLMALGTQVEIKGTIKKGRIEIPFSSTEELERIYQILVPNEHLF